MHANILFYFLTYSFLGWCLESIYKTILERRPVNSGFLYGPFCPIYGFGAIMMIVILQKIHNIFLIFIISTILLTIWEYMVGAVLEKVFKTKYWDYSHIRFNINGRVCLKNSIYWGILGVAFTTIIHPAIENLTLNIPTDILINVNIVLYAAFISDVIISITKILFIDKKIQKVYELSNIIKEKLQELRQGDILEKVSKEALLQKIGELKTQQAILKFKTYKLLVRLKKAFPTMQSETITNFINPKVDVKKLKEKIKKNKEK